MERDFAHLMANKSDESLRECIAERKKYTPGAIHAAINELKKRGHSFSDAELLEIENDLAEQDEAGKQRVADADGTWDKNVVAALAKPHQRFSDADFADIESDIAKQENTSGENADLPELYSEKAIYGFTVFFGVFFGSVLMAMNIKRASAQNSVGPVILFGIAYTILQVTFLPNNTMLTMFTSLGGALIFNYMFWKQYIGADTPYRARAVWGPLAVGIGFFALILLVLFLSIR